ncbi:hypothetical protein IWX47DRAFT_644408 [Phyllosticta citricarpa]
MGIFLPCESRRHWPLGVEIFLLDDQIVLLRAASCRLLMWLSRRGCGVLFSLLSHHLLFRPPRQSPQAGGRLNVSLFREDAQCSAPATTNDQAGHMLFLTFPPSCLDAAATGVGNGGGSQQATSTQTSKQASKQSSTRRRTSCTIQQQLTGQVGGSAQTASDGNIAKLLGFWICCCSSWRKKFWTVDFFFPPSHPSLLLPFDFLLFLSHIASFLFTHAGLGSGSVELGSLRTRAIYHHIHTHYATRARAPTPLRLHWVALLGWAAPARGLIILLISFELAAALHCAHVFLHRYHQPDSSFVAFDEDTDGSSYG